MRHRRCDEAGTRLITGMYLHLRGPVKSHYLEWLRDAHPDLVRQHQADYATSAYAPPDAQKRLSKTIQRLVEKHGGPPRDRTWAPVDRDSGPSVEQLRLTV